MPEPASSHAAEPRVARLVHFFEGMTPAALGRLGDVYADDCRFKDPFNEVTGIDAIRRIYAHMYQTLDEPRFEVTRSVTQGHDCVLTWNFLFRLRSRPGVQQTIRGASHLVLAPDGRITQHRDYWDAAEELYEKLPLLGTLMRWLKRRVQSS